MLADHRFVRAAAAQIAEAAEATCTGLAEGLIRSPRVFTDRFVRRAAKQVDGFRSHELRWGAQAYVDREAEEGSTAEILGTLEVDLPDYSIRKGFLACTLLIDQDRPPEHGELAGLRAQCERMLAATSAAFVFVYRPRGVIVVPAGAVAGSLGRPDRLHRRQVGRFYEEHFSCFIGDGGVGGASGTTLEDLARGSGARTGLALHVEPASTPRQESLFRR